MTDKYWTLKDDNVKVVGAITGNKLGAGKGYYVEDLIGAITPEFDPVNKPKHYNSYPGIEVIQLTKHMNFCRGNAVKYLARAEFKGTELEDLKKAQWYINCEIERMLQGDYEHE